MFVTSQLCIFSPIGLRRNKSNLLFIRMPRTNPASNHWFYKFTETTWFPTWLQRLEVTIDHMLHLSLAAPEMVPKTQCQILYDWCKYMNPWLYFVKTTSFRNIKHSSSYHPCSHPRCLVRHLPRTFWYRWLYEKSSGEQQIIKSLTSYFWDWK